MLEGDFPTTSIAYGKTNDCIAGKLKKKLKKLNK